MTCVQPNKVPSDSMPTKSATNGGLLDELFGRDPSDPSISILSSPYDNVLFSGSSAAFHKKGLLSEIFSEYAPQFDDNDDHHDDGNATFRGNGGLQQPQASFCSTNTCKP